MCASVSGKIDSAEENTWIENFDKLVEEHGTINILVVLDGKINYGIDVVYNDLKWTFKNLKHMNKLAIVFESTVLKWLVAANSPFGKLVGISKKHFDTNCLIGSMELGEGVISPSRMIAFLKGAII